LNDTYSLIVIAEFKELGPSTEKQKFAARSNGVFRQQVFKLNSSSLSIRMNPWQNEHSAVGLSENCRAGCRHKDFTFV
jgi:hypothetical protein